MAISEKFGICMEALKGLEGYLTLGKKIDVPTCVALFYILHYTSPIDIFSLEYCGVEPKIEVVTNSRAPSTHPSTSDFIGLGLICVQGQPPLLCGLNPFCHSHSSGNLTLNGFWYAYLRSIMQTPSVGWICGPYSEMFWCDQS
jgi:hypothetical protein